MLIFRLETDWKKVGFGFGFKAVFHFFLVLFLILSLVKFLNGLNRFQALVNIKNC